MAGKLFGKAICTLRPAQENMEEFDLRQPCVTCSRRVVGRAWRSSGPQGVGKEDRQGGQPSLESSLFVSSLSSTSIFGDNSGHFALALLGGLFCLISCGEPWEKGDIGRGKIRSASSAYQHVEFWCHPRVAPMILLISFIDQDGLNAFYVPGTELNK